MLLGGERRAAASLPLGAPGAEGARRGREAAAADEDRHPRRRADAWGRRAGDGSASSWPVTAGWVLDVVGFFMGFHGI